MKGQLKIIITFIVLAMLGGIVILYPVLNEDQYCPLQDIGVGEKCTFYQSFENYCMSTGDTTIAMNLLNCACNEQRELICLEDLNKITLLTEREKQ